jgi:hypothetical protein
MVRDPAGSDGGKVRDDEVGGGVLPRSAAVLEVNDAELERWILDALATGLDGVAKALAGQLEERRRARAGNAVELNGWRGR